MPVVRTGPELVELSQTECMDLLGQNRVGRIGISVKALPVILPVNYVVFDGDVVLRTIPGTKLQAATAGSVVAFEVDGFSPDGSTGWSVMVQGVAQEVVELDTLKRLAALPLQAWALNGAADRFVRIETSIVTGRRFYGPDIPAASRQTLTEPGTGTPRLRH